MRKYIFTSLSVCFSFCLDSNIDFFAIDMQWFLVYVQNARSLGLVFIISRFIHNITYRQYIPTKLASILTNRLNSEMYLLSHILLYYTCCLALYIKHSNIRCLSHAVYAEVWTVAVSWSTILSMNGLIVHIYTLLIYTHIQITWLCSTQEVY